METFRANHPSVGFVILGSDEDDTLRNYSGVDIARLCVNEPIEVGEELHSSFPKQHTLSVRRTIWIRVSTRRALG